MNDKLPEHIENHKVKGISIDAKHEDERIWTYGYLVVEHSTGRCFILDVSHGVDVESFMSYAIEVHPETVCRFTGIKINDNEVYENDVVYSDEMETYFIVKWDDTDLEWCLNDHDVINKLSDFYFDELRYDGNTFDNYLENDLEDDN